MKTTGIRSGGIATVGLRSPDGQPAEFLVGPLLPGQAEAAYTHAHRHTFYTVLWVEAGTGTHELDFRSYPLRPPELHFVSPEQIHQLVTPPGAPPQGCLLRFTPDFLTRHHLAGDWLTSLELFFNCDEAPPLAVPAAAVPRVRALLAGLRAEFDDAAAQPLHADGLAAWLRLLLIEARRLKLLALPPDPGPTRAPAASTTMRRFKTLVEQQFRHTHSVSEYAGWLALSPDYLNELVKHATGTSAKQFILGRALLEARRLAVASDLRLKEVAGTLGFADPTHFAKLFSQQQGGESFTAFRARARAEGSL